MNNVEILKELIKIFKRILEIQHFSLKSSMENIPEWDSLKHIQLISAIEDNFEIEIDFEDVINMTSIPTIVNIVRNYLEKK